MAPYFRFNVPCAITTTTTTTTTTAPPCYCFGVIAEGGGNSTIQYSRCNDGTLVESTVLSGNTSYFCSRVEPTYVSGATPTIFACNIGGNPQTCTANAECIGCIA